MTKQSSVEATVGNLSPIHSYPAARTAVGLPIKKFIQNHEIADGESISSWIESMKASSPTNVQGPPPPSIRDKHPSALSMFEEIINLFKGKKMVMFLDYDGTLSPIVDDPDRAFMSKAMRAAVRDVAKFFPTAIVSGRCRDKVYRFVRLAELYYAGSHGMDIKCPQLNKGDKPVLFQPASEFLPMIDEISKLLIEKTSDIPGSTVENNRFCVSVHFRCVEEERWVELATQVRSVLHDFPKLRLNHGRKVNSGGRKRRSLSIFYEIISEGEADEFFGFSSLAKVLEIRPIIEWDKGKALEFMLESLGLADSEDVLPVYIGDDLTDEDAFKVLRERGQGLGILVSKLPKKSHASYSLQEPSEVMSFLHRLVEWKRISGKGHPRV